MKLVSRTLQGVLSVHNKGTLDWGHHGLIAYGCSNIVAVVDSKTLQLIHGLNGHKTAVTKVRWMPSIHAGDSAKHRNLYLASADTGGSIFVWDVFTAGVRCTLAENNKVVNGMEWLLHGRDAYVLALYQSSTLILWRASSGEQVWKKNYGDTLIGFCLDPFNSCQAAFQGVGFVLFISDLSVSKCPNSSGKKFQISSLGSSSSSEKETTSTVRDFTHMIYHRAQRDHLMLVGAQEIMIIDLDIKHTTGIVTLDKANSPFQQVWSCRQRDVLYSLHESGCLSMRRRRRQTMAASTRVDRESLSPDSLQRAAQSLTLSDQATDISYELLLVTDSPRLSRSQRAVAMAVCPMTETKVALISSDGKLMVYDIQKEHTWVPPGGDDSDSMPVAADRLVATSGLPLVTCLADLVPPSTCRAASPGDEQRWRQSCTAALVSISNGLPEPPLVVRMCPPLTTRNWNVYQPLLAVGSHKGMVLVYNLATGLLQKEISVHSCQVRGIEWTSMSSLISFAHDVAGSSNTRSEIAHVDLRTGRVTMFKICTTEETMVTAIRVSYLKQYLLVLFKGKQAELWDARSLALIREMPHVFPYATAVEWSSSVRRAAATDIVSSGAEGDASVSPRHSFNKEQMLVTDEQAIVHSFTVEGSAVNQVASMGISGAITAMAWKVETLVLGSSEGVLSFMDLKARTTQIRSTDRGHVRKLRFAPGKGAKILIVLLHKELQVWDAAEITQLSSLRFPRDVSRVSDVDWANHEMLVFSAADGYVTVTRTDLKIHNTSLADAPSGAFSACAALLPPDDRLAAKALLCYQPWKSKFSYDADDSSDNSIRSSGQLAACLSEELREHMLDSECSIAERCLIVARMLGDCFEADFWTVALHYLSISKNAKSSTTAGGTCTSDGGATAISVTATATALVGGDSAASTMLSPESCRETASTAGSVEPLEACYDLYCDNNSYRDAELTRVLIHDSRRATADTSSRCAGKYVLLGETDRAVHLLLDTDPSSPHYLTNCLKACLLTSARSSGASLSTIKLVATNLIASGKLSEGILLLCLIDKGLDACRYLQTYSLWEDSVQLAKLLLGPADNAEVIGRWIDHLCSPNVNKKEKAILAALSTGQFVRAIELLYGSHCFSTAALFAEACQQFGVLDYNERTQHIVEAVYQQYARVLGEHRLHLAASFYQAKAGLSADLSVSNGLISPDMVKSVVEGSDCT